jgi:hypothetical protein
MRMRQLVASFLAPALVATCGGAEPAAETPFEVTIGPGGVAGLSDTTPFTIAALEQAFPDYTVIPVANAATASAVFEIRATPDAPPRFIAEPDWSRGFVGLVRSRDPAVRGPLGEVIGEATLAALPPAARALCTAREPGTVVCPDPEAPDVFVRLYALGPSGTSQGAAVLDELRYIPPRP